MHEFFLFDTDVHPKLRLNIKGKENELPRKSHRKKAEAVVEVKKFLLLNLTVQNQKKLKIFQRGRTLVPEVRLASFLQHLFGLFSLDNSRTDLWSQGKEGAKSPAH